MHDLAGEYGIDLDIETPGTALEMRSGGPTVIQIVFDQTVIPCDDGSLDVSVDPDTSGKIVLSSGSGSVILATTYLADDTLMVSLSGVNNNECLSTVVKGMCDSSGTCAMDATTLYLRVVRGELDDIPPVNIQDLSEVKRHLFADITAENFIYDLDCNGSIALSDFSVVKSNLFQKASCP